MHLFPLGLGHKNYSYHLQVESSKKSKSLLKKHHNYQILLEDQFRHKLENMVHKVVMNLHLHCRFSYSLQNHNSAMILHHLLVQQKNLLYLVNRYLEVMQHSKHNFQENLGVLHYQQIQQKFYARHQKSYFHYI